jgi:hypothetical protein
MWETFLGRQIRRGNKNRMTVNIVVIVAVLIVAALNLRYLRNLIGGPFPITLPQLEKLTDVTHLDHYFVSTQNLEVLTTGVETVTQLLNKRTREVNSERTSETYFAAKVADRFLIVISPSETPADHYEGALRPVPAGLRDFFQKELLNDKNQQFDQLFVPYVLDAHTFDSNSLSWLIFGGLLSVFCLFQVGIAVWRNSDPTRNPAYKTLAQYGSSPELVAQSIDSEIARSQAVSPIDSITLTPSWLIRRKSFGLEIMKVDEIVWVYEKVSSASRDNRTKKFIILIWDAFGNAIEVDCGYKDEPALAFLKALREGLPWANFGYTSELIDIYASKRGEMAAAVQARRAEYRAHRTAPEPSE